MSSIVNIAAYKFAPLENLAELKLELRQLCEAGELRGTILLSTEGINLFLAGEREEIDALLSRLRDIPVLDDLPVKESFSDDKPFSRLLVKIKREIIPFGIESVDPRDYSAPRISARELKQWLDAGKPVTLLDTRNNFEVKAGTFENALAIGIDTFRDFPQAVRQLPEELKSQPIVTFCTGGIRCEKAAPYLEQQGFSNVFQLDGGILKYFEECGGDHFRGECFVFDQRVAVNAALEETETEQCFVCQAVVSVADQASPKYVIAESCPACYKDEQHTWQRLKQQREAAIRAATSPLPGSVPYQNERPLTVPLRCDGMELLDFLEAMKTRLSRNDWSEVCAANQLICRDVAVKPGRVVRAGEFLLHLIPATIEPDVNAEIRLLYEDDSIIAIDKPTPLPMHPCGRFNRNSLTSILNTVYEPLRPKPAHRLDAETSGVVLFSKTQHIARLVQPQFDRGDVRKLYLARVIGTPSENQFECQLAIGTSPGPDGARIPEDDGAPAHTRFRVKENFTDGTTLLEVEPLTGRTNQIRIHLWSLGLPIVGDPIYFPGGELHEAKTRSPEEPGLCLHAKELEFTHPISNERMRIESDVPKWGEVS